MSNKQVIQEILKTDSKLIQIQGQNASGKTTCALEILKTALAASLDAHFYTNYQLDYHLKKLDMPSNRIYETNFYIEDLIEKILRDMNNRVELIIIDDLSNYYSKNFNKDHLQFLTYLLEIIIDYNQDTKIIITNLIRQKMKRTAYSLPVAYNFACNMKIQVQDCKLEIIYDKVLPAE